MSFLSIPAPPRPSDEMLNLDALQGADMWETPFRWAHPPNPVSPGFWRELVDGFPPEGWFTRIEVDDILMGPVINQRIGLEGPLPVSPVWDRLIRELCGRRYREALERLTGLDLREDTLQFNFNRYNPGNWSRPHLDSPHNSLVHLLYLNERWLGDWGGHLAILHDEDPASLHRNVLPAIGSSVLLIPSSRSWHMVTPIGTAAPQARLSFKVTFLKPAIYGTRLYEFHQRNGVAVHKV